MESKKEYLIFGLINLAILAGYILSQNTILSLINGSSPVNNIVNPWSLGLPWTFPFIIYIYLQIRSFFVCNSYKFFFIPAIVNMLASGLVMISAAWIATGPRSEGLGGLWVIYPIILIAASVTLAPLISFIIFIIGYHKNINRPYKYVYDIVFYAILISACVISWLTQ